MARCARWLLLVFSAAIVWGTWACEKRGGASALEEPVPAAAGDPGQPGRGYEIPRLPADRLRLSGAAKGLDGLLQTLEQSLAEKDSVRLQELLVTPLEYRDILFPSFPAAHPPINADFETVWLLQASDSQRGLRQLLRDYGGRKVRILGIRFERPNQDFVNFVLDESSHVDVDVDGVRTENLRLFGSVFHSGDQYKILSYPDD
jgi:hypothetical protein